jgi:hypothetical protein
VYHRNTVANEKEKNPHAVALGRLGGAKGGKARAEALTPEKRTEIATKAGKAGGTARAKNLTKEQRSESARKASAARWLKAKKPDSK